MKKIITNLVFVLASTIALGQTKKSTAVSNPNVTGLDIESEVCAKMMRMEFIKLKTYSVYDEFDMKEVYGTDSQFEYNCLSKSCLVKMGNELGVDYMTSGSYDLIGKKIVISIKMVDVKSNTIFKSSVREFDNQISELQRMTEIVIKEMFGIASEAELVQQLDYENDIITKDNVGKVNNSGPRIGIGVLTGSLYESATRPVDQGGFDLFPAVSMIGYQAEVQYVGTENFSALFEFIGNISGLEQGRFMPTLTIMNGFRFGKKGWEFAFGPGFGVSKVSRGFFDNQGLMGDKDRYYDQSDFYDYTTTLNDPDAHPEYFQNGYFEAPTPEEIHSSYNFDSKHGDDRGSLVLNTTFVFGIGRTFKVGSLNIPVNVFYSARKKGGIAGLSVGFNVTKKKSNIQPQQY